MTSRLMQMYPEIWVTWMCKIWIKVWLNNKGSFTYYIITKEEGGGGFGMITLM